MLKVSIEGIYVSKIGTGQVKYCDFKYDFKTSRLTEKGIHTHIEKRFIPMLVAKDKSKKDIYSGLKYFNILAIEKIDNESESIFNKKINELDEWEIQDLACTFDLYSIPLHGKLPINTLRNKAIAAYFKKVWGINFDDPKQLQKIDNIVKNSDGSYSFDFSKDEVLVKMPKQYLEKNINQENKIKLSDVMNEPSDINIEGLMVEKNQNPKDKNKENNEDNGSGGFHFPSISDLFGKKE